jgi:hypothetical protein
MKKLLVLLAVLLLGTSCDQNSFSSAQPEILAAEEVNEYWKLVGTSSFWEISDEGVVNFLDCSVSNGYVKHLNVSGRIEGDSIVIRTGDNPTVDITSKNDQMIFLGMKTQSKDVIVEIPRYTVVKEIPKHCDESTIRILSVSTEQLKLNTESEISIDIDYRLEEASAEIFVKIVPEISVVFDQKNVSVAKIMQTGVGSKTVKTNYKPGSVGPHFLYVIMVTDLQTEEFRLQPYMIDLVIVDVES